MKSFKTIATTAFMGLTLSAAAFAAPQLEPGTYTIDPMHSKVGFEVSHLVISSVEGRFKKFDGTIVINKNHTLSKALVSIDASSVDTDVEKRDQHLKSPDFFDTAKYPKISFKTTKVTDSDDGVLVTGDLTIKGVTHPVSFDASYLGEVKDGYGQEKAAFKGKTKISRKDFGLTWNQMVEAGPVVGDEVEISLNIQAVKGK